MIHPTAVIHRKAELASDVTVGPYAVIDEGVRIGAGCIIGPHVYLTGLLQLGANNRLHAGCVIGEPPQDLRFVNKPTQVIIGENNTFREHVTIHRSNNPSEPTQIGSGNLLMAHSHVGHNGRIGNQNIIANGALLAGHVEISDRVFISGNCLVHQFVRVGQLALMQGGSAISKDLPPFTTAQGDNTICGLNTIGLRRAGITSEERLELRRLYHALFRKGSKLREAAKAAQDQFKSEPSRRMLEFILNSRRGIVTPSSRPRLTEPEENDSTD